jgi:hypothetical protein
MLMPKISQIKGKIKNHLQRLSYEFVAFMMFLTVSLMAFTGLASAAQITSRKLTLTSSVASAVTTYTFSFVLPTTGTNILSAEAVICTTASGSCTTPGGFSVTGSTLPSQPTNLGDASGWTVNTATAGSLRLVKAGNASGPSGTTTITWGNVTNPSATNATFFARITTYSAAGWTGAIDTGTVAASTAGQITVTASVDEALTFTLSTATVALGTITSGSTTGSGSNTMTASTNGQSGYTVTVNGVTLTSGSNTIAALAVQTASNQANSQFGINLVSNTTPSIGSNVSGGGSGTATANYGTTNQYRFVTGDSVASAAAATNSNTFTVSYVANVSASQAAGAYSTALTYIATAQF